MKTYFNPKQSYVKEFMTTAEDESCISVILQLIDTVISIPWGFEKKEKNLNQKAGVLFMFSKIPCDEIVLSEFEVYVLWNETQ